MFKLELPRIIADASNDLTPTMRRLLQELFDDLKTLEGRIAAITREIETLAAGDEKACRLITVPGIGPLSATALLAAAGDGRQFKKARDMAALSRSNIPQGANPRCWASASVGTDTSSLPFVQTGFSLIVLANLR